MDSPPAFLKVEAQSHAQVFYRAMAKEERLTFLEHPLQVGMETPRKARQ
jgi:hypothetical protein